MAALSKRVAYWGHWGITFYWDDGGYAPTKIEGDLDFPVGNCGPCDGFIGGPERAAYRAAIVAWATDGVLPANLRVYQGVSA